MSIIEGVGTRLRYCQEVLAVCGSEGLPATVKCRLVFDQDDSEYNEWLEEAIGFDWETYSGSDEDLMTQVVDTISVSEGEYLSVYNSLKELDK
tara:strand:- start:34 stop:312 length:279 start_codon:yes stop_codon:yes gene_type:complete